MLGGRWRKWDLSSAKVIATIYQGLAKYQVLYFTNLLIFGLFNTCSSSGKFFKKLSLCWSNDLPKVTQSGFGPGSVCLELASYLAYGTECRHVNSRCVSNEGVFLFQGRMGRTPRAAKARHSLRGGRAWAHVQRWGGVFLWGNGVYN